MNSGDVYAPRERLRKCRFCFVVRFCSRVPVCELLWRTCVSAYNRGMNRARPLRFDFTVDRIKTCVVVHVIKNIAILIITSESDAGAGFVLHFGGTGCGRLARYAQSPFKWLRVNTKHLSCINPLAESKHAKINVIRIDGTDDRGQSTWTGFTARNRVRNAYPITITTSCRRRSYGIHMSAIIVGDFQCQLNEWQIAVRTRAQTTNVHTDTNRGSPNNDRNVVVYTDFTGCMEQRGR